MIASASLHVECWRSLIWWQCELNAKIAGMNAGISAGTPAPRFKSGHGLLDGLDSNSDRIATTGFGIVPWLP
jgi:hypothetical protein